jgi:hypothetical protein
LSASELRRGTGTKFPSGYATCFVLRGIYLIYLDQSDYTPQSRLYTTAANAYTKLLQAVMTPQSNQGNISLHTGCKQVRAIIP